MLPIGPDKLRLLRCRSVPAFGAVRRPQLAAAAFWLAADRQLWRASKWYVAILAKNVAKRKEMRYNTLRGTKQVTDLLLTARSTR
ncbi:hypothetical protein [Sporomusa sphaeroides]|uniref:hypothetical protein n=1 Tax=Sporomusa sphaeroides TaxID=47679 RepID=UPI0009519D0E|nr:hypothetical protein [Sporomusa sphaeroides]